MVVVVVGHERRNQFKKYFRLVNDGRVGTFLSNALPIIVTTTIKQFFTSKSLNNEC